MKRINLIGAVLILTAICFALPPAREVVAQTTNFVRVENFTTYTGALTETSPGTDTASSGLNGRLQRIAQRLTSVIALLPTALGGNGGLKVDMVAVNGGTPTSSQTFDFDTGGGTATREAIGLMVPASGGAAVLPGDATDGLKVQLPSATVTHFSNLATYLQPGTMKRYISAGSTEDESEVKNAAGVLYSISARNVHATAKAHVKCTNATAANTTPGTTTVWYEMVVPPTNGGFIQDSFGPSGVTFGTALTCYIVLGAADNAVDEVAAGDVTYNLVYR